MLYLITYKLYNRNENVYIPFFEAIGNTGDSRMLFEGCYLVDSNLPAQGIRKRLLAHVGTADRFFVVKVFKNHSAGRLSQTQKDFLKRYICDDPFPKSPENNFYQF